MNLKDIFKNNLVSNFLSLAFMHGTNYLLPLITIPYLYRILHVEKYGLVMFGMAFIQYFLILTDFGFNLSATRKIAVNRESKTKVNLIFNATLQAKFFLIFVSFLILLISVSFVPQLAENKMVFILFFGMVLGHSIFPIWYFQGIEKMQYVTIVNIVLKLLSLLPIFIFVKNESDYLLVPIFYSLGYILAGIYSLILIKRKFDIKFFICKISNIKTQLRDSLDFFLSRVSVSLYTISNPFILGLMFGNTVVGYYSIAEKLYRALQSMYAPVSTAVYPYMAKERNIKLYKKLFTLTNVVNLIVIAGMYVYGDSVLNFLFKEVNDLSVVVLRILLLVCIVNAPSALMGYPFLAALGYTKFTNYSVIIGSIGHVIGLLIMYYFGLISPINIAFMLLFTESFVFLIRLGGTFKYKLWKS